MDLPAGLVIAGRYEIVKSLGRGGVGEVFEALHLPTRHPVALKLLHAYVRQDEDIYKRFQREARAAGMLSSAYVAQLLDMVEDDTYGPALVFERLAGESLHERLRRTPLDPPEVDLLVEQSLRGLMDAHAAGIIHRDLKPANIFLQKSPKAAFQVKILDFGISKLSERMVTPLTRPQQSLGSLAFMPPEQFERAADVDARADLYALGTVAFRVLSGELPYQSTTLSELLIRKRHEAPRSLSAATGMPFDPLLEGWMARMLAREPEQRFSSASEALQAWRSIRVTADSTAGPSSRPPPSGSRGAAAPP